MKSYEDMVREAEERMGTERELEGLVPVKARVAKEVRHVFSVRMSPKEMTEIARAAEAAGITMSDFIRQAAMAAVQGQLDLEAGKHRSALLAVREKARDLYEAVEKLDEQT